MCKEARGKCQIQSEHHTDYTMNHNNNALCPTARLYLCMYQLFVLTFISLVTESLDIDTENNVFNINVCCDSKIDETI